jgi:hypothetical protein
LVVVPIKHAFPVASNVIGVAFIQSSLETWAFIMFKMIFGISFYTKVIFPFPCFI